MVIKGYEDMKPDYVMPKGRLEWAEAVMRKAEVGHRAARESPLKEWWLAEQAKKKLKPEEEKK